MRIHAEDAARQPKLANVGVDMLVGPCAPDWMVRRDEIAKRVSNTTHRIEHMHRSLRGIRDEPPAHGAPPRLANCEHIDVLPLVAVAHTSTKYAQRRHEHTEQHLEQRRFSTSRLTRDTE